MDKKYQTTFDECLSRIKAIHHEIITCPKCGYNVTGLEQWGCHCDLEPGAQPDACVLDDDNDWEGCMYALKLHKEGKTKESCQYWRKW